MSTLFFLSVLSLASAQDVLSLEVVRFSQVGGAPASLRFIAGADGTLNAGFRCGGVDFQLNKTVESGHDYRLLFDGLPEGRHPCEGKTSLREPTGVVTRFPVAFDLVVLPSLGLSVRAEDLQLSQGRLLLDANRPLKSSVVQVYGDRGRLLAESSESSGKDRVALRWAASNEEVLRLHITGTDFNGFTASLDLSPWFYAIPHEDIAFSSGRSEIPADQLHSLEAAWDELQRVLVRYGEVVQVRLFVAGYTDTVGAASYNERLSTARAKSIARWFKQRGFTGPVAYQGFGESAQVVLTGDEVDSAPNRRAVYLLSADVPPLSPSLPRSSWTDL